MTNANSFVTWPEPRPSTVNFPYTTAYTYTTPIQRRWLLPEVDQDKKYIEPSPMEKERITIQDPVYLCLRHSFDMDCPLPLQMSYKFSHHEHFDEVGVDCCCCLSWQSFTFSIMASYDMTSNVSLLLPFFFLVNWLNTFQATVIN